MIINGIFSTRVLDYDNKYVFMTLEDGHHMFKRKKGIDGIDFRVHEEQNMTQSIQKVKLKRKP